MLPTPSPSRFVTPRTKRPAASWHEKSMKPSLLMLFAGALFAADQPHLFYSKAFPGSSPAYVQVTLEPDGQVEYREAPDDESPLKFKLTETETTEVYGLA